MHGPCSRQAGFGRSGVCAAVLAIHKYDLPGELPGIKWLLVGLVGMGLFGAELEPGEGERARRDRDIVRYTMIYLRILYMCVYYMYIYTYTWILTYS